MTGFRYSRPRFRTSVLIAAVMTAAVCAGVWMLATVFGVRHAAYYAAIAATIFFAFISATMLVRYLRGEVVLAARPTGLYDGRWRSEAVPWDSIREVVVRRKEDEIELDVYLWQRQAADGSVRAQARPDHTVELAPLEGDAARVVEAIARHVRVRSETDAGEGGVTHLMRARG